MILKVALLQLLPGKDLEEQFMIGCRRCPVPGDVERWLYDSRG